MLNDKARAIYDFLVRFAEERGFPPTIREIGEEFDIRSTNGVRHDMTLTEREGCIRRDKRISRGIDLLRPSSLPGSTPRAQAARVADAGRRREDYGIPILGRIAAGGPIAATEEVEGYVT